MSDSRDLNSRQQRDSEIHTAFILKKFDRPVTRFIVTNTFREKIIFKILLRGSGILLLSYNFRYRSQRIYLFSNFYQV